MVRQQFRHDFFQANLASSAPLLYAAAQQSSIVIAWHVREGDMTFNAHPAYLRQLHSELSALLKPYRHQVLVISENELVGQLDFFKAIDVQLVHGLSVAMTLHHLIQADVLVTSGSGLAAVAAMYTTGSLILQAPTRDAFIMAGGIIATNGSIIHPEFSELQRAVAGLAEERGAVV